MKRLLVMVGLVLVVGSMGPLGVVGASAETASSSGQSLTPTEAGANAPGNNGTWESFIEEWADERAGPWTACAIFGAWRYARYLVDKSDWVNLVLFSRYLEQGECFWRNYERAAVIYREGAKAGREVAALYLGYLYLHGLGVERDVKQARRWFDLGVLYQIGVGKEYQIKYTSWVMGYRGMPAELMEPIEGGYRKLEGDGIEIFMLAQRLRLGTDGMTKNLLAAARLYRVARLAWKMPVKYKFHHDELLWTNAFETSDRSDRESEMFYAARGLLDLAALYDHGRAAKMLADFFVSGEWIPKNFFAAYVLYRAAQRRGLDVADQIDQIRPKLSTEQISQVEEVFRKRRFFVVMRFLRRFEKLLDGS